MPSHIPPPLPGCCWLRVRVTRRRLLRGEQTLPPADGRTPPPTAALYHYFDVALGVSLCSRLRLTPDVIDDADPSPPPAAQQCPDCRKVHLDLTGGHPLDLRQRPNHFPHRRTA